MLRDSIKLYWKFNWIYVIEFMEGLIVRKIDFGVNLGFNWKKLKFWGQIIFFLELIWSNWGLNCINIKVWWPIGDLIEEIWDQGPKCKTRANWRIELKSSALAPIFI